MKIFVNVYPSSMGTCLSISVPSLNFIKFSADTSLGTLEFFIGDVITDASSTELVILIPSLSTSMVDGVVCEFSGRNGEVLIFSLPDVWCEASAIFEI